uniref:Uncharacterized protein n=1 Tax=Cacopsylla melanoneura TaxID=428564 RepID=A0A8D8YZS1_9HEMI
MMTHQNQGKSHTDIQQQKPMNHQSTIPIPDQTTHMSIITTQTHPRRRTTINQSIINTVQQQNPITLQSTMPIPDQTTLMSIITIQNHPLRRTMIDQSSINTVQQQNLTTHMYTI